MDIGITTTGGGLAIAQALINEKLARTSNKRQNDFQTRCRHQPAAGFAFLR